MSVVCISFMSLKLHKYLITYLSYLFSITATVFFKYSRVDRRKKRFTHAVKFLIICWQCNNFSISRRKEKNNNTKQSIPKKFFPTILAELKGEIILYFMLKDSKKNILSDVMNTMASIENYFTEARVLLLGRNHEKMNFSGSMNICNCLIFIYLKWLGIKLAWLWVF